MIQIENDKFKKVFKILIPFALIPLIIYLGINVFDEKKYLFISLIVVCLSLLLFICGIERKNIGSRRLVIVSIMIALCVVGRMIPFLQPTAAFIVITAVYLGGESGFLVGSLTAFFSNFYFGQGPWTPFQMLALGLVGLFAGYLSRILKKNKWLIIIYGVLAGFAYSMIMDVWSTIWYSGSLSVSYYLAAVLTALPHTLIYILSNTFFLIMCSEPIGKKLARVKVKYGI